MVYIYVYMHGLWPWTTSGHVCFRWWNHRGTKGQRVTVVGVFITDACSTLEFEGLDGLNGKLWYGGFHKWGVPQVRWMVYKGQFPLKWMMNRGTPNSGNPRYFCLQIVHPLIWWFVLMSQTYKAILGYIPPVQTQPVRQSARMKREQWFHGMRFSYRPRHYFEIGRGGSHIKNSFSDFFFLWVGPTCRFSIFVKDQKLQFQYF